VKKSNRGLFMDVFLIILGFTFIPLVLLALLSVMSVQTFVTDISRYELIQNARMLSYVVQEKVAAGADAGEILSDLGSRSDIRISLITREGVVRYDSYGAVEQMENHVARPEIRSAFETGSGSDFRYSSTLGTRSTYAAVRLEMPAGHGELLALRLALPLPLVENRFRQYGLSLFFALLWILGFGILAAVFFSRRITKPVAILEAAACNWASGSFGSNPQIRSPRELANLSASMNSMAADLEGRLSALKRSGEELHTILEAMGEALVVSDPTGMVQVWNPEAEKLFGSFGKVLEPQHTLLDLSGSSELAALEIRCRNGKREEATITLRNGRLMTLRVYGAPLPERGGAVLVISDISRMVQLETVRRDFVANVSHELKTPIQSIKGFSEALLTEPGLDKETRTRFLGIILRNSGRMEALITDLLTLARLEHAEESGSLKPEAVDLAELAALAIESLIPPEKYGKVKVCQEGDDSVFAAGNSGLLEQALGNLLDNAVRYSPPGSAIRLGWKQVGGQVEITVKDNGPGIPAKEQDRIFERFYRLEKSRKREAGGTGLGLAIVRHVARLHGGTIRLESRPGKGSAFTLTVPAWKGKKA